MICKLLWITIHILETSDSNKSGIGEALERHLNGGTELNHLNSGTELNNLNDGTELNHLNDGTEFNDRI